MEQKPTHSPTPWTCGRAQNDALVIEDANGFILVEDHRGELSVMQRICTAVNAHDALVEIVNTFLTLCDKSHIGLPQDLNYKIEALKLPEVTQ